MMPFIVLRARLLLIAGIAIECGGMVATRYWPLPRAFVLMALGGIAFYLGAAILVVAGLVDS